MRIVFARKDRAHKLTDDEYRGIAGVVMNIFQSRIGDLRSVLIEKFHIVAVCTQNADDHFEMHREHRRDKNGIILFHVLGERYIILFHITAPFLPALRSDCANVF